jgi:hypothetical protein
VTNLPDAANAVVLQDGVRNSDVEVVDANTIRVHTDIQRHQYEIYTGYFGQKIVMTSPEQLTSGSVANAAATRRTAQQNVKAAESVMASGAMGCPCCAGTV